MSMVRGKHSLKFTNNESGMTLIEVAIGMILLGLIAGALLPFYKNYKYQKVRMDTLGSLGEVQSALTQYALINGGYPIPAKRDLAYTDANFGYAASIGGVGNCVINDPDVCRLTGTSDKAGGAGNDPVLRGDVPFATLGLPYTSAVDGYGNRLTYAVSEYLTVASAVPFDDNNGVVRIQDESSTFVPTALRRDVSNDAHYALVSHGRNGVGSYTRAGILKSACDTADTDLGRDRENCDLDAIYTNNFIVYTRPDGVQDFNRTQTDVDGTAYYDDYVRHSTVLVQGTWLRTGDSISTGPRLLPNSRWAIKVGDQDSSNTIVPYHVPGNGASAPIARLNLVGTDKSLIADQVNVNRICDTTTAGCNTETHIGDITGTNIPSNVFHPAIIGVDGSNDDGRAYANGGGINCGVGGEAVMNSISFSEEGCLSNDTVPSPDIANTALSDFIDNLQRTTGGCADLTWAQGVSATGELECVTP